MRRGFDPSTRWGAAVLGLALLAGAVLGGCSSSRACRDGTLFVTLDLGDVAKRVQSLELDVALDDMAQPPFSVPLGRALAATESFELKVPTYAIHTTLVVVAVARDGGGVEIARASSPSVTRTGACVALSLSFVASTPAGTGGAGGGTSTGGTMGTGGKSGTGGATSTGGHPASGGAGGKPGTGGTASGGRGGAGGARSTSCALIPDANGFISAASNAASVQGWSYVYDSPGATIALKPSTGVSEGKLCVSGKVAQVTDGDYMTHLGAGVGFDLCNPGGGGISPALGACPLGTQISGLQFVISGNDVPAELRMVLGDRTRSTTPYVLVLPGANTTRFADARVLYDNTAPAEDLANVQSINFSIPSSGGSDTPFEFCVEQIVAINQGTCPSSGAGGAGGAPNVLHAFDATSEGFALSDYDDPGNLGVPGSMAATLAWDPAVGDPAAGSLRAEVTYSGYNQYADVVVSFPATDLRGRVLHTRVRFEPAAFTGGALLHAGSGPSFIYATGPSNSPLPGVWTDLLFDMSTVDKPGFDPSTVVQLGVQLFSGGPKNGATAFPGPLKVVFHLDTFTD